MHCNHLVYNDSSILGGGGGGGGAFIGNHVHKALVVKCTCAMHVSVNNSYNLNIYRYLTSTLCAHLYQRWHKRNCPIDLEGSSVKVYHHILLIWKMSQYMCSECGTSTCTRPSRETTFSAHVGFTICFISTK